MWKVLLLLACVAGFDLVFCDVQCGANERYVACPDTMCIPQNCSQRGYPVPCPILGPDGTCPGQPKCICVENYLRDDDTGVCIPSKKCKSYASSEADAYASGSGTASATATATASATSNCGCGGHPPRCGKNEVYNDCSENSCRPQRCSELGYPLDCKKKCKPGCICKDGYIYDDNGVCIPINKCPSCGGDKNAESGCGTNCGKTCATYNTKPAICPLGCRLNGCDCRDGYVYDANVKKCVSPCDCTPICKANEEYNSCINGGCDKRNCSQIGQPKICIDPKTCIKGCVCVKGYLRASNGTCVPEDQCIPTCGKNEYYEPCIKGCSNQSCSEIGKKYNCPNEPADKCKSGCRCKDGYWRNDCNECIPQNECPTPKCPDGEVWDWCPTVKCDGDYCPKKIDSPQTCPVGIVCDEPRCVCASNRKRDWKTGKCILKTDCPPICKANEEYNSCINGGCDKRNCSQIGQPKICIDPITCIKGCVCVKGYLRAANGTCVPEDQCIPTCGKNEYYEPCIKGCSNQSCSDIGKKYNCPNEPADKCKSGCRCKDGYWRNDCNECIPQNECPTPKCPDGEVWDWCPTVKCDGDYCPKKRDSPQTCPVGIVCDPPRCVCAYNRKRDWKTGKCIPITDCPPFKCDCNEEYQACPANCPSEQCSDYINKTKCPPFKIGILHPCRPACKCIKGFCRDDKGNCIPACQCSTS